MKHRVYTLLVFIFFTCGAFAQNRTVGGTVSATENGEPLVGVTVKAKGTDLGAVTDLEGRFSLEVPADVQTLVFSLVGFTEQAASIGLEGVINVSLDADAKTLDEYVVIGYGTKQRRDLTGSVASISAAQIKEFPVVSVERVLQGRVAGVQVSSNTGQPGGGLSVRIRGVGTVNNNEPLYVIDGVPIFNDPDAMSVNLRGDPERQNPLALLNSNDVESVEILKDASATAIYGSRANNGVVIITTKRGKEGRLKIDYESFAGYNQLGEEDYGLMDSQTWGKFAADLITNSGATDPLLPEYKKLAENPNAPTYKWADEVLRRGPLHSHQLSLSGGSKNSRFFLSGNFYSEDGVFINSGFKRYSLRLNTDHQLGKRIKIGNTMTLTRSDQRLVLTEQGNGALFLALNRVVPPRPFYNADGTYSAGGVWQSNQHAIATLREDRETLETYRILGSLYGELEIAKGLSFKTVFSADNLSALQELFQPPIDIDAGSAASRVPTLATLNTQNRNSFTWFTDNYLNFSKKIGEKHDLSATAGMSAQLTKNRNHGAQVTNFITTATPYLGGGINQGTVGGGAQANGLVSYFVRGGYSFDDRYLLNFTVRRDGSSRFGSENRFGTFPAASIGWRVSNESFLRGLKAVSNLKLRASWGRTGGQEIGNYSYFNTLGRYDPIIGNNVVGGYAPQSLANPALKWEATEQSNFGLDLGLFNNRIDISADYFIRNTTNLLLRILPPVEQGAISSPFGNLGEIENKGFEFSISSTNVSKGGFRWTTDGNFATVDNKVLALAADNAPRLNTPNNANFATPSYITRVGGSIGSFYLWQTDGIFQTWDEVYNSPRQNTPVGADGKPSLPQTNLSGQTAPGDLKFKDIDGDGLITPNDRVEAGKTIPDFTWGLTNNFSFKGVGLSIFVMGVHGVDIYNGIRASRERTVVGANLSRDLLDSWRPDNTGSSLPRAILQDPNLNSRASTRFLEDGSFVRLKNIRISYDLPSVWLRKAKISNIQLYATGLNLYTFTKYTGFDPEVGSLNQRAEQTNLDAGQYPLTKQYIFGIRAGF
jgi:TonB-dependent starch-binding outer membrane protein SusC